MAEAMEDMNKIIELEDNKINFLAVKIQNSKEESMK